MKKEEGKKEKEGGIIKKEEGWYNRIIVGLTLIISECIV